MLDKTLFDIIETFPFGITISDNDGNIVNSNKEGARLLGLKSDGSVYTLNDPKWHVLRRDLTVMPGDEYPSMRALRGNCRVENEEVGVVIEGEITWINITAAPLPDGKGVIVAYVDISKNIEYEKNLEKLIKDREKLINIIAHDLRNPFTTILGFIELLRDDVSKNSIDNADKYLQIIHSAAKQTFELLENMLEWSKSRAGIIEFNPEVTDITLLVAESVSFFRSMESKKGIRLNFKCDNSCFVRVDRNMMEIVLRNLLTNAVKYSYHEGEVVITVHETNSDVTINIRDFGVGIEPARLKTMFDDDRKLSTPGTEMEKGSGLGLMICKEFINKHQGTICIESEIGKGSNFMVTIPKGQRS
jgi:PAS domain S-box-containing protein